jgi:hypothetical protein
VYDPAEAELPDAGLLKVVDSESGLEMLVDSSDQKVRDAYRSYFEKSSKKFKQTFARSKSDTLFVEAGASYIHVLHQFFKKRAQ